MRPVILLVLTLFIFIMIIIGPHKGRSSEDIPDEAITLNEAMTIKHDILFGSVKYLIDIDDTRISPNRLTALSLINKYCFSDSYKIRDEFLKDGFWNVSFRCKRFEELTKKELEELRAKKDRELEEYRKEKELLALQKAQEEAQEKNALLEKYSDRIKWDIREHESDKLMAGGMISYLPTSLTQSELGDLLKAIKITMQDFCDLVGPNMRIYKVLSEKTFDGEWTSVMFYCPMAPF